MLILCANIDKCDDTVPPLHIAMQCSKQIGWHAADNSTLTATKTNKRLELDLQKMICEKLCCVCVSVCVE